MGVLSEQLLREQAALLAEIDAAFADVNRDGGVSWSEAEAIDDRYSESERLEARQSDKDLHWSELVNDKTWDYELGMNWCFLDPIGFRYYLPPSMKRCMMIGGHGFPLRFWLEHRGSESSAPTTRVHSLLNERQRVCVGRFLRFMVDMSREEEWGEDVAGEWEVTLQSGWPRHTSGRQ